MSELSPTAQEVLDAFGNARDGEYVDGVWVVDERTMIAAALRALTRASFTEEVQICGWGLCRAISTDDIHAIADELEAQ